MYSCALWSEEEGGVRGDLAPSADPLNLERAQIRKIHHVLQAARVKPGDRILEFGSGWGGLSIEVLKYQFTVYPSLLTYVRPLAHTAVKWTP